MLSKIWPILGRAILVFALLLADQALMLLPAQSDLVLTSLCFDSNAGLTHLLRARSCSALRKSCCPADDLLCRESC